MKIAFPVKEDNGLASVIDKHFGVAAYFLIVDTDTRQCELKENRKLMTGDAKCKTGVLDKEAKPDAVVTQCMGDGSRRNLESAGIKIYQAQRDTIAENLDLMEKDELKLFHIFDFCRDKKNKKKGGCGHHH